MTYHVDDTIVAIASAAGRSVRGIVRVAGPQSLAVVRRSFQAVPRVDWNQLRSPRAIAGVLQLPPPLGLLECEVYVWPGVRSYTRQPSAEIHMLGSPPLLNAAVVLLCAGGARLAEPGEFTLRAFLSGRLDLTQAEAVLGVIDARDQRELDVALSQLAGGLTIPLTALREDLLDLLSQLEAALDFAEEDLEFISRAAVRRRLADATRQVSQIREQLQGRTTQHEVPRVVLVGWPNVGKSSLFNALVGNPAAIVSPAAGTTRDYLTRTVRWDGCDILLVDTAGYLTAEAERAEIEAAAQQLMEQQARQADLLLLCLDSTRPLYPWEESQLRQAAEARQLVVWTKADHVPAQTLPPNAVVTSSRSGSGLDDLRRVIREKLAELPHDRSGVVTGTALRCRDSLRRTALSLHRARRVVAEDLGDELLAAELRSALEELGQVVGAVYTDDILDRIFRRFCIGK